MQRKIIAICAALVALGALAIAPALASAATLKDTTAGGVEDTLAIGAKVTTYSTGTSLLTGSGINVECNESLFTGEVDKNNGTEAQVTITDAWFNSNLNAEGTKCKGKIGEFPAGAATIKIPALTNEGGGGHWCLRNVVGEDKWELWGNNCTTEVGTGELTFIVEVGGLTCKFRRTAAIKGTYTTTTAEHKAAVLTMTNDTGKAGAEFAKEEGSSVFCPASGLLSNMVFDTFTDPGTANTWVNPTGAPNPVFISNP